MEPARCQYAKENDIRIPQAELAANLGAKDVEALDIIKEDVCRWLSNLLKEKINSETFWLKLDTGTLLCRLANLIHHAARRKKHPLSITGIKYNEKASQDSFSARDNTSNFISWCRQLGVEEAVIFESEGLVLHKDEKRVILCLLGVARFAEGVGLPLPQLVCMEKEIKTSEAESSHSNPSKNPLLKGPGKILEQKVRELRESDYDWFQTFFLQVLLKLRNCKCTQNLLRTRVCGYGTYVISGGRIRGEKTIFARVC